MVTITSNTTSPTGDVGAYYSQTNTASGGSGNYGYACDGSLPAGTNFDYDTGEVSGILATSGQYTYVVFVLDIDAGGNADTGPITATIYPVLAITPNTTSPTSDVGAYYSQTNTASGGSGNYIYFYGGTLPAGTVLNTSTGEVSGILATSGQYTYYVSVSDDAGGNADTGPITATIYPVLVLAITPNTTNPTGDVGAYYSQTNPASGGSGNYSYDYGGTLPAGTVLNTSTGEVSGILATSGQYTYYVSVSDDAGGNALTEPITATIADSPSCFNHDTKILCLNKNLEEEYIFIQDLRIGDFVKTYLHGYRKISCIGKGKMINNTNVWNYCMYKMKKTETNQLTDDLIVTGGHAILVDELSAKEKELQEKEDFSVKIDDKHLLLLGLSDKFIQLKDSTIYIYYHLVPENNGDDDQRFGIWANGVLSETPSKNQFISHKYEDMEVEYKP